MLFLYLIIYVFLLISVSAWLAQSNTDEDFLIAGRNRKHWQIMSSKFANSVGVSWFITYTGFSYLYGFSVLSILPGLFISYLLFAYWVVPKIYLNSKKDKFYTQGDFVFSRTQSVLDKQVIDVFGVFIAMTWLLVAIIGGAKVISFLGILSFDLSLFLTSSVILIYILLSGYKAIVITDVIQALVMFVLFGVVIYALINHVDTFSIFEEKTEKMKLATIIGFFIFGLFSVFTNADRYFLTYAANSEEEAKRGMAFAIVPIVLVVLFLLIIGLYVRSVNANLSPDLVFIELFFSYLPEAYIAIGALLFLTGLMSSADTKVYSVASYIAFLMKNSDDKVNQIRKITVALIFVITLVAFFNRDIIGATVFAAGFSLSPSVAMIYIIAGGKDSGLFRALLLCGFLGFVLGLLILGVKPSIAIFPIVFSLFGFLVNTKLFSKRVNNS